MRPEGYCDLNILYSNLTNLRAAVIQAFKLGYQTVAINQEYTDEWSVGQAKKKKNKKEYDQKIPNPIKVVIKEEELKQHGITFTPKILNRLTVTYAEPGSPLMHKGKHVMSEYDILAFTPTTENALKQVCQDSTMHVDIISLDYNQIDNKVSRKMLQLAISRDVYFELSYSPCIGNSSSRQNMLILAHHLFGKTRCKNIIVTSRAQAPRFLRSPYDVMNLSRFFNLTPLGAKESILGHCHNVLHCANARRTGWAKCAAQITTLNEDSDKKRKFEGLDDVQSFRKSKKKKKVSS